MVVQMDFIVVLWVGDMTVQMDFIVVLWIGDTISLLCKYCTVWSHRVQFTRTCMTQTRGQHRQVLLVQAAFTLSSFSTLGDRLTHVADDMKEISGVLVPLAL